MKKGKIKNALKIGLCSGGVILYLTGVALTYHTSEPLIYHKNQKEEIIKNYRLSQEYKDLIYEKANQYKEEYLKGKIPADDYFDAVDQIFLDEYAEKIILESERPEAEKISQLNENIKTDSLKVCATTVPMFAGAVASAVGLIFIDNEKEKE